MQPNLTADWLVGLAKRLNLTADWLVGLAKRTKLTIDWLVSLSAVTGLVVGQYLLSTRRVNLQWKKNETAATDDFQVQCCFMSTENIRAI